MKGTKIYCLNPSQSRRLIAKGIVALPQIQDALKNHKILVTKGSTNAYILEELYKLAGIKATFNKGDYTAGQIVPGKKFMNWGVNVGNKASEILLDKGQIKEVTDRTKEIYDFHYGDIILKGGNAIDSNGVPAVLVGAVNGGGTIGAIAGTVIGKGIQLICPIGLEKLIMCDLNDLAQIMGSENMDSPAEGMACGLFPMPFASSFTEIDALELLFNCDTYHVASGGVGGAEGSVSLLVDCYEIEDIKTIDKFMQEIASEPVYQPNK